MRFYKNAIKLMAIITMLSLLVAGCGKSDDQEKYPMREVAVDAIRGGYAEDLSKLYKDKEMKVAGMLISLYQLQNSNFYSFTVREFVNGYNVMVSGLLKKEDIDKKGIKQGDTIAVSVPFVKEANYENVKGYSHVHINQRTFDKRTLGTVLEKYTPSKFTWENFEAKLWASYSKLEDIVKVYDGETMTFTGPCTIVGRFEGDYENTVVGFHDQRIKLNAIVPDSEIERLNIEDGDWISVKGVLHLEDDLITKRGTLLGGIGSNWMRYDSSGMLFFGYGKTVIPANLWLTHKRGTKVSKKSLSEIDKLNTEIISPNDIEKVVGINIGGYYGKNMQKYGFKFLKSDWGGRFNWYSFNDDGRFDFKKFIPEDVSKIDSYHALLDRQGHLRKVVLNFNHDAPINEWLVSRLGSKFFGRYFWDHSRTGSGITDLVWQDSNICVRYLRVPNNPHFHQLTISELKYLEY